MIRLFSSTEDFTKPEIQIDLLIRDGVVYKRIAFKFKEDKGLKLVSDNKTYEPYWVETADILEVWKAKAFISTQLPEPTPEPTMETLTSMMAQMQKTINAVVDSSK